MLIREYLGSAFGINSFHNEVQDEDPKEAERIRALIRAYQTEAKDVLYEHFVNKRHLMPSAAGAVVPAETPTLVKPTAPEIDAPHEIWIDYHQQLAHNRLLRLMQ